MFKQSPSRHQRSKGFKVKHALQIFLLISVCAWLLYQVKHSYDKKAFDERNNVKTSEKVQSEHEVVKYGRKDLHPQMDETTSENERHNDEEEIAEENSKPEEESKPEERENEGRGIGDDEIGTHNHDKAEEEAEHREESRDEGEKESRINYTGSSGDQDLERSEKSTQKAREEHYKGDDASSAVGRDTQIISTKTEHEGSRNSNEEERAENTENSDKDQENKINSIEESQNIQNDSNPKVDGDIVSSNASESEEMGTKITSSKMEDSYTNLTITTESNGQTEVHNNSIAESVSNSRSEEHTNLVGENAETGNSFLQNGTDITSDSTIDQNATVEAGSSRGDGLNLQINGMEQTENPNTTSGVENLDSNTILFNKTENSSESSAMNDNGDAVQGHNSEPRDETEQAKDNPASSNTNKISDIIQNYKTNTTVGAEEAEKKSASSTMNENSEAFRSSKSDTTLGIEEAQENLVSSNSSTMNMNINAETENNPVSLTANENSDAVQSDKSEKTAETEEAEENKTSSSTTDKDTDTVQSEVDSSILQEVKDARIDLGTLPETETEGKNSEDVAA